jgi:hypothetical protein
MSHDTTIDAGYRAGRPMTAPRQPGWFRRLGAHLGRGVSELQAIADEAAAVRAMAYRLQDSQPGFASDLLAAADRHQQPFEPRR